MDVRVRAVLVALVLVASWPARAVAQTGQPGLGIRLTEAPVERRDDPRARRYIVDHIAPGTTIHRGIEVTNGTDRAGTVQLYPDAARIDNDEFVPLAGHSPNELTGWTKVDPASMTLTPGQSAKAEVTITVPSTAAAGERYGVVFAELPPPPDQQAAIGVSIRAGIRIYLSVGPGGEPPTSFALQSFTPSRAKGAPVVVIHACNTGGRAVDLTGDLRLTDGPGGVSAGPLATDQAVTLAPGQCGDVPIVLDPKLPRGPWKATVTLRSGQTEHSATAGITFPAKEGTGTPVRARSVTGTTWGRGVVVAAVIGLLAVLALLLVLLWRRRRDRGEDDGGDRAAR